MGKNKKNVMHDAAGKKIMHPADAIRKQAKKRRLEKVKKERHQNFEKKLLSMNPEDIESDIRDFKDELERKKASKQDISKWKTDKLNRLEVNFKKLKEKIVDKAKERAARPRGAHEIDFEELKIFRKYSVFYHPVTNPYGAPPTGQILMYRHPDGSTKREPPELSDEKLAAVAEDQAGAGSASGEDGSEEDSGSEDEDDEPMLPPALPGAPAELPPGLPPLIGAGLPPGGLPPQALPALPPGLPPGVALPPLPLGQPPLPSGQPPLPRGPALPPGQPPLPPGQPPLPLGQPPLPPGMPPLPVGPLGAGTGPLSKDAFAAEMAQAGLCAPVAALRPPGPPGPPTRPSPRTGGTVAASPSVTVSDLPAGAKPPPPPPKKAAAPKPLPKAATFFTPTNLRTKKVSQVAGGVLQASSSSLSMAKRKEVLLREVPTVGQAPSIDDAFKDFMSQMDDD